MSSPTDLNQILFDQLNRLQSASGNELEAEINKAKAIEGISEQVIKNNTLRLKAVELIAEYKGIQNVDGVTIPQNLIG